MAIKSKIEWTESTWNPVTGCSKISDGCKNCYAERLSHRLKNMGQKKYKNGFKITTHEGVLNDPINIKKPRLIFVSSMSDLFHKDIPVDFMLKVFKTMNEAYWHKFLVLTKRADRILELNDKINWSPNIGMGVTVESNKYTDRIDLLRKSGAKMKFLSLEPLLSSILDLNLENIDWVIVGGESSFGARPIKKEWVIDIKKQCITNNVSFFFKQWGGINKKASGRLLEGKIYEEYPKAFYTNQESFL